MQVSYTEEIHKKKVTDKRTILEVIFNYSNK